MDANSCSIASAVVPHDEWAVARRYMDTEGLAKARLRIITGDLEEVTAHALTEVI